MIYGLTTMVLTLFTWWFAFKCLVKVLQILREVKRHA